MKALEDYIPYSSFITDEIIKVKGGSYLMCFELHGTLYQGIDPKIVSGNIERMNNLIKRLRAPTRFNMYVHLHCLRDYEYATLTSDFQQHFAKTLNDNYFENKFSYPQMANRYFISIIYRPYRSAKGKSLIEFSLDSAKRYAQQAIDELEKVKAQVLALFESYKPRVLSCYEKDGVMYSDTLRFLNNLVNFDNSPVPVQHATIDQYLPQATLSMSNNGIIKLSQKGFTQYASMISIFEYPNLTYDQCLQTAMYGECKSIISQVFVPIDKIEAQTFLRREQKRVSSTDNASPQDIMDIEQAVNGVTSDNFVLGEFYWQLTLIHPDPKYLQLATAKTISHMSDLGFISSVNEIAKLSSYLSNMPANIKHFPRTARVSSANFSQMMSFLQPMKGKKTDNPWGEAITALQTIELGTYYFNFHNTIDDKDNTGDKVAGNTVISGKTGTGKTVFLSFLLAQTQRLAIPPRLFIFDMDLGSSVFVKAMGGKYSQIRYGVPTGFNPFHLENTPENQTFLRELVMAILGDEPKLKAREVNQIEEAVRQTMAQPKQLRDIEAFANFLPDGDDSIRQRLKSWTTGQYAWVFNNPEDNFDSDARILGIDYTQFLDIPALSTPILMYIFHRIQQMQQTKEPYIISLDEAWKPLSSPRFQQFIIEEMRTIRKKNGILLLTTQAPDDFYNNVSPVIMQQVGTQIFLPNPLATPEIYCEKLGFYEDEFARFLHLKEEDRKCLIKTQKGSVICSFDLGKMREIDVLSGSEERAEIADRIIERNPENWIEEYYEVLQAQREKHRKNQE